MRLPILLSFLFPLALSAQISITGLYNTGVNNAGEVLAAGSLEQHYTISSTTDPGATVSYAVHDYIRNNNVKDVVWYSSDTASWISPYVGNDGYASHISQDSDTYLYSLAFTIDAQDSLSNYNISISGSWASDNSSSLFFGIRKRFK